VREYREKYAYDEPALQLSECARLRKLAREKHELKIQVESATAPADSLQGFEQLTKSGQAINAATPRELLSGVHSSY
jgi:hypothetical protein